jgi:hypothetical protein
MRCAAGEVHTAAPDFNEKQHVQPLKPAVSTLKKSTAIMLFT